MRAEWDGLRRMLIKGRWGGYSGVPVWKNIGMFTCSIVFLVVRTLDGMFMLSLWSLSHDFPGTPVIAFLLANARCAKRVQSESTYLQSFCMHVFSMFELPSVRFVGIWKNAPFRALAADCSVAAGEVHRCSFEAQPLATLDAADRSDAAGIIAMAVVHCHA